MADFAEANADDVQYVEEGEEEQPQQYDEYNYDQGEVAGEVEYTEEGEELDDASKEAQLSDTLDYLNCHEVSTSKLLAELNNFKETSSQMSNALSRVREAFLQYTAEMDSDVADERLLALKKATDTGASFIENLQKEFDTMITNLGSFACQPLSGLVNGTIPYAHHSSYLYKKEFGTATAADDEADANRVSKAPSVVDDDVTARAAAESGEESLLDRALNVSAEAFETACSMPAQVVQSLVETIGTMAAAGKTLCDDTLVTLRPEQNDFAMMDEATYEDTAVEAEEDYAEAEEAVVEEPVVEEETTDLHPDVACGALIDLEDDHYKVLSALHVLNDELLADKIEGFTMTPQEILRLFCNTAELFRAHEEFIPLLHEALKETYYPTAIVALYKKFFPRFERMYLVYTENDPLARVILENVKDVSAFKKSWYFKIKGTKVAGQPITDFYQLLSAPHNHMKRQQEALKELLHQTSSSDPLYAELQGLLEQYSRIPKGDASWESTKKLLSVEEWLAGDRVVRRGRRFICRGLLAVSSCSPPQFTSNGVEANQDANITLPDHIPKFKKKGKLAETGLTVGGEYRCVLFNDQIIFAAVTDSPKKGKEKADSPTLYKIVQKWNVLSIIPRHAPPTKNSDTAAFFLHTPNGLFCFEVLKVHVTGTGQTAVSVCEQWFTKIENVIRERRASRVYGMPLDQIADRDQIMINCVPAFISLAADYIEQEGLNEEGVFRQSAATSVMTDLIGEIDSGSIPRYSEVHAAANVIKKWLRDLPNRLLVNEMGGKWEAAGEDPEKLRNLVLELPPCNRATLIKIMHLCRLIVQHSDKNLMSSNNLGIVVGVNLLPSSKVGAVCFEAMLRHYDEVFTEDVLSLTVATRRKHRKSKAKSHHKKEPKADA